MRPVELTARELALASFVACQRNADGVHANADAGKFGYDGSTLDLHLKGCLGEIALAKALNRYWTGAGTGYYDDDDVGQIQVRVTRHDHGCLLVRPNEGHLEAPWVLVVGVFPNYSVRGWLWGYEARQDKYLRAPADREPAYFVPQPDLRPIPVAR